jgi:hypothetical protein
VNCGLQLMLDTLEAHQLQVVLVPLNPSRRGYNEGGCRRVVAEANPKWYRTFCGQNPSSRGTRRGGFDTRIRRFNTLRALRQMLRGQKAGKYEDQLRAISRQQKAA